MVVRKTGRFLVELKMREPEYDALSALIPGFGNTVEDVIQFIITDWLMDNLGMNWMQEQQLVKASLGKLFRKKEKK
jgi:uncharacterized protein involved in cysteine biosynthesis